MSVVVGSLRKVFDVPGGEEVAVRNIDLEVGEDEFLSILGPSGCGKTTTLRCIAGLEMPTSGTISFDGMEYTDVPANKRNIAMMFQNIALYPHMTVIDNISYPLKVRHIGQEERYEKAQEAAKLMQIGDLLDKHPQELSGGQRQRAALARTIVQDPQAFLMDEPLSDLDARLKVEMRKEIQRIHRRVNRPTIYVTHDQEEAMTMSDRIAVMNDGAIEQIGSPDDLYERPVNLFVAQFIGNPSMNFMTGNVVDQNGTQITVEVGKQEIDCSVSDQKEGTVESEITVGFRPETVELGSDDSAVDGQVEIVERIGERRLVTINGPEGELLATVPSGRTVREGEQVSISLDSTQVHLFDSDTGVSLSS